jgi:hypothetical protein
MKKSILSLIMCFILTGIFAQTQPLQPSQALIKKSKTACRLSLHDPSFGTNTNNSFAKPLVYVGLSIGETWYDLQTNKSVQNRICTFDDHIAAVWTMSHSSSSTFPDRGSGYNISNGSNWQTEPVSRIEDIRTGFPSLTLSNGNEVIIAHNTLGLTISSRVAGTGSWLTGPIDYSTVHSLAWPRAMCSDIQSPVLHLIATDYSGSVTNGLLYSRSVDGGLTWDIQDSVLPGLNPLTEMLPIGGDSYCMDVKGDTVGIVAGDMTTNVILIKSFDGGNTWSSQTVFQHPIPLWNTSVTGDSAGTSDANGDGNPDTLTVTDGRYALVIGEDGTFHVFMGITKISRSLTDEADYFSFWPYTDGLVYWNSNMAAIVPQTDFYADTLLNKVGYMLDLNGNGTLDFNTVPDGQFPFGDFSFTSISSMPSAAIGDDGTIYCSYSSVVESTDCGDGRAYRNIYVVKSSDNGNTWSDPVNISQNDNLECLFGSLCRNITDKLYIVYQRCAEPGIATQPNTDNPHLIQENQITFAEFDKDLSAGIENLENKNLSVSQNYPNPFSTSTTITVDLKTRTDLSLSVSNLLGQKIYESRKGTVNAGSYHFSIDGSSLIPGVYTYTVKAGDTQVTNKMIVE